MAARRNRLAAWMFVLVLSGAAGLCPAAAKSDWDRTANIKGAAKRLAALHRAEGSQGVVKFLDACYKTHTLAAEFTEGLEACMVQDYMHSRVLAEIYAKVPQEARVQMKAPSPEFIAKTMNARFGAIVAQYKMPPTDIDALEKAAEKDGLPIFIKTAFPPRKKEDEGADKDKKDDSAPAKKGKD